MRSATLTGLTTVLGGHTVILDVDGKIGRILELLETG